MNGTITVTPTHIISTEATPSATTTTTIEVPPGTSEDDLLKIVTPIAAVVFVAGLIAAGVIVKYRSNRREHSRGAGAVQSMKAETQEMKDAKKREALIEKQEAAKKAAKDKKDADEARKLAERLARETPEERKARQDREAKEAKERMQSAALKSSLAGYGGKGGKLLAPKRMPEASTFGDDSGAGVGMDIGANSGAGKGFVGSEDPSSVVVSVMGAEETAESIALDQEMTSEGKNLLRNLDFADDQTKKDVTELLDMYRANKTKTKKGRGQPKRRAAKPGSSEPFSAVVIGDHVESAESNTDQESGSESDMANVIAIGDLKRVPVAKLPQGFLGMLGVYNARKKHLANKRSDTESGGASAAASDVEAGDAVQDLDAASSKEAESALNAARRWLEKKQQTPTIRQEALDSLRAGFRAGRSPQRAKRENRIALMARAAEEQEKAQKEKAKKEKKEALKAEARARAQKKEEDAKQARPDLVARFTGLEARFRGLGGRKPLAEEGLEERAAAYRLEREDERRKAAAYEEEMLALGGGAAGKVSNAFDSPNTVYLSPDEPKSGRGNVDMNELGNPFFLRSPASPGSADGVAALFKSAGGASGSGPRVDTNTPESMFKRAFGGLFRSGGKGSGSDKKGGVDIKSLQYAKTPTIARLKRRLFGNRNERDDNKSGQEIEEGLELTEVFVEEGAVMPFILSPTAAGNEDGLQVVKKSAAPSRPAKRRAPQALSKVLEEVQERRGETHRMAVRGDEPSKVFSPEQLLEIERQRALAGKGGVVATTSVNPILGPRFSLRKVVRPPDLPSSGVAAPVADPSSSGVAAPGMSADAMRSLMGGGFSSMSVSARGPIRGVQPPKLPGAQGAPRPLLTEDEVSRLQNLARGGGASAHAGTALSAAPPRAPRKDLTRLLGASEPQLRAAGAPPRAAADPSPRPVVARKGSVVAQKFLAAVSQEKSPPTP